MSAYNKADYDTQAWRDMRDRVIAKANRVCAVCNGFFGPATTAHHVHYDFGVLDEEALVAVCAICHENLHQTRKTCAHCGEDFWQPVNNDPDYYGDWQGWFYDKAFGSDLCNACNDSYEREMLR